MNNLDLSEQLKQVKPLEDVEDISEDEYDLLVQLIRKNIGTGSQRGSITRIINSLKGDNYIPLKSIEQKLKHAIGLEVTRYSVDFELDLKDASKFMEASLQETYENSRDVHTLTNLFIEFIGSFLIWVNSNKSKATGHTFERCTYRLISSIKQL